MLFQFLYIYYSNTFRNVGELFEDWKDTKLLDSCHNDWGRWKLSSSKMACVSRFICYN